MDQLLGESSSRPQPRQRHQQQTQNCTCWKHWVIRKKKAGPHKEFNNDNLSMCRGTQLISNSVNPHIPSSVKKNSLNSYVQDVKKLLDIFLYFPNARHFIVESTFGTVSSIRF